MTPERAAFVDAILVVFPTSDGAGWDQIAHTRQWAESRADALLAALGDRAAEEGRPFDTKRMTQAWAILESRVQVGDNATEAWEPDRYNAAAFVAALLREYARLGDRAAEEGR